MQTKNRIAENDAEMFIAPHGVADAIRFSTLLGALYALDKVFCTKPGCTDCPPHIQRLVEAVNAVGKSPTTPIHIKQDADGKITLYVHDPKNLLGQLSGVREMLQRVGKHYPVKVLHNEEG